MKNKKIKLNDGECEVEGYIDLSNEDKPKFKIRMKGKCPSDIFDKLN